MSDLVPIEHWVGWISQALKGNIEIVIVLQIALQGLANDVGPAALQLLSGCIQRINKLIGNPGGDLAHVDSLVGRKSVELFDINIMSNDPNNKRRAHRYGASQGIVEVPLGLSW